MPWGGAFAHRPFFTPAHRDGQGGAMTPESLGLPRAALAPLLLAGSLAILPVAIPPESEPWAKVACLILVTPAVLLMALRSRRPRFSLLSPALLVAPLALVSILGAACRSRAVDAVSWLVILVLAGGLGHLLTGERRACRALTALLVVLGSAAAIQAAAQHHLIYPQQAAALRASDDKPMEAALLRLESGRPAGPFILPAALAGFLALSLPAAASLVLLARRPTYRALAAVALGLQGYALFLSRSLGGLAAASIGLLLVLSALTPRHRRSIVVAAVVVVLLLGGAYFVHSRRAEFDPGAGGGPLALRAGNWSAAARMIVDHPLFGVGPGSFGTFYPRYMRAGMNETQYAHNSYLQIASTWGLWTCLPLGLLLWGYLRATGRALRVADPRLPLMAGAGAFLAHNLVDFTAFLPGVAIPASLLVGLSVGSAVGEASAPARGLQWTSLIGAGAVSIAMIALAGQAVGAARAEAIMDEAQTTADAGEINTAARLARRAADLRPGDPEPWAYLAQLVLAHPTGSTSVRKEGAEAAARAVALDPESAILHYTWSRYHRMGGENALAYRELRRAHRLYPLKELYRSAVVVGEVGVP